MPYGNVDGLDLLVRLEPYIPMEEASGSTRDPFFRVLWVMEHRRRKSQARNFEGTVVLFVTPGGRSTVEKENFQLRDSVETDKRKCSFGLQFGIFLLYFICIRFFDFDVV